MAKSKDITKALHNTICHCERSEAIL